jgi:hypothetical protein
MNQPWIPWIVFALIVASVLYELATGTARVRGIGAYPLKDAPKAYWIVMVLKGALAAAVAWIALHSQA